MENYSSRDKLMAVFIFFLVVFAFASSFSGGFFLRQLLRSELVNQPLPPPAPLVETVPGETQKSTEYLPGKHFYDEGFYVVTKDEPMVGLVISVTRLENEKSTYQQSTRVSYFNRETNVRLIDSRNTPNSAIVSDKIISSWKTTIDSSRVLRESSEIALVVNNTNIQLSTGQLSNELPIRSLPGYTKFFSNGNGTLTFNGVAHPAHVLYYRLYSQNAADLEFYTQPIGLTTDLVVFWDEKNNLYLIDKSEVAHPIDSYVTHQVGFFEDAQQRVSRTFVVNVKRDLVSLPNHYELTLGEPINLMMNLTRLKSINKAPGDKYNWYISTAMGSAQIGGQVVSGRGIVEYIRDLK